MQKLELNPYFKTLNLTTKYAIVYEMLQQRTYYPAELIMSIHQRSPMCSAFQPFYKDSLSKFKKEIDNKLQNAAQKDQFAGLANVLRDDRKNKGL